MCHVSGVTCQISCGPFFRVGQIGGGSITNRAYNSLTLYMLLVALYLSGVIYVFANILLMGVTC